LNQSKSIIQKQADELHQSEMAQFFSLGIDFGTSYSSMCYCREIGPDNITFGEGNQKFPSLLSFNEFHEYDIGDVAFGFGESTPYNLLSYLKRFLFLQEKQ
jgi:molecular chaperone DnaK (HSP70)